MIILADNDIIHKLTCCDLLLEFIEWLESPPNEIWVLPELKYKIRRLLKSNAQALERFNLFVVNNTKVVPEASVDNLNKFASLDVGEQKLLAVFIECTESARFVTGDKRALKDIAKLANKDLELQQSLTDKVDCLEKIMLGLVEKFGFSAINTKVCASEIGDGVLKMAFGRDENHAKDALKSYLLDLKESASFITSI